MLFSGNITRHPSFENVKYRIYGNLKNTDFIMNNTFWIGVYPGLTDEMIEFILNKFREFIQSNYNGSKAERMLEHKDSKES